MVQQGPDAVTGLTSRARRVSACGRAAMMGRPKYVE